MENLKNKNFIDKCFKIHGDKYDYSVVEYINNNTKVKIICPIHGIFEQAPIKHVNRKQTCPKCTGHHSNTETFIQKAKLIHNDTYDYSSVIYINAKTKVKIICPVHGVFEQTPNNHLSNKKCYSCTGTPNKTTDEFIYDANIIHNNKYDYSLVNYYKNNSKIEIICNIHGIFNQIPASHLNGSGCPSCNYSKGESLIQDFLLNNCISFIPQKRFKDCRNLLPLPFDFYLPDYNTCIEYNGEQHYKSKIIFGGEIEFNKVKLRDKIKSKYCKYKDIKLLIIKYDENITDRLNLFFT